ncbi:MAG: hypothetical protein IJ009_01110 [Clostridia bacterium]|nr:hypothetical protein [Clostridia bacterium]
MKRFLTLALTAVLLCSLVLTLASCSSYGKIEKNFLKAGYEVVDTTNEDGEDVMDFVADLEEDGEVSCTIHILKKDLLTYAIILEFDADKDAQAKLDELLTDKDYEDLMAVEEKSDYINGNCVLVPCVLNLFDLDDSVEEMVDIFDD